jgi:hypothetical protein
MIFVQKDPHPEDRGKPEHPRCPNVDSSKLSTSKVQTDDGSALGDEMRSRLQEIYVYYGISWFAQPIREGSLPIRWRADLASRETDVLARLTSRP